MIQKFAKNIIRVSSLTVLFALILLGCVEKPIEWDKGSDELVITEYIDENPQYSEFGKLVEKSGLTGLLSVRGPFTLFLPDNTVMLEYYSSLGYSSFEDITDTTLAKSFAKTLVYNHLIGSDVQSGDIGLGAIKDTNALGDYLVTEFAGSDIIINKTSMIIDRDIPAANGHIHQIDHVIAPVTESVYDYIAANPEYSIFKQGLEKTGLKDTLQTISFPYGSTGKLARNRYTILAVPDSIYEKNSITNIDELVDRYTNRPDSVEYISNGFYRYMEYHCLLGTHFLNNFTTRLYPILSSDNNVSVTIDSDYRLNLDKVTKLYTGFIVAQSNVPAKNGTIHAINNLLEVIEPEPQVVTFETTDYFDMKQGDYFGKYYARWHDGQNTFAKIKWEGDYLLYYFKDHDTGKVLNDDCLSMSGWWWCQVTTPKIMKGKYKVTSNLWSGQIDYAVYVDGVQTAQIKSADPAETTSWGEFNWPTTSEHTIKVVAMSSGLLFWDTIIFTPIK